jgi:hypothetical protein
MSPQEVARKFEVELSTVINWCKKGYIRGLSIDEQSGEYIIPSSVKRPYTQTRAKGDAIYTSIVKAVLNDYDICAELFHMESAEFEKYIGELKECGLISSYISETGIEYYCRTLKSSDFSKLRKNRVIAVLRELKPNVNVNLGINVPA